MIREFDDIEIVHVEGDVDPLRDIKVIHNELLMKDLMNLKKIIVEVKKEIARFSNPTSIKELEVLEQVQKTLESDKWVKDHHWHSYEIGVLNKHIFFTAKPVIYLVNMS